MLVVKSWRKTRSIKSAKGCWEILKTLLALSNYVHSQSYWFSHGGYESLLLPSNKEAGELMNPLNRRSFMQNVNSCWLKWIFKFSLFFPHHRLTGTHLPSAVVLLCRVNISGPSFTSSHKRDRRRGDALFCHCAITTIKRKMGPEQKGAPPPPPPSLSAQFLSPPFIPH